MLSPFRTKPSEGVDFLYGCGIWELRDFYTVWEFKKNIQPVDRGTVYNYACHLSRSDRRILYYVILGDLTDFYIVGGLNGNVISVKHGTWVSPGAKNALAYNHVYLIVKNFNLLLACDDFFRKVLPTANE
jgi:hypothetical protein